MFSIFVCVYVGSLGMKFIMFSRAVRYMYAIYSMLHNGISIPLIFILLLVLIMSL